MSVSITRVTGLAVIGIALSTVAVAHDASRFTFPRAEFLPGSQGMALAQAFVAQDLPRGLPMTEAVARVRRAVMACHPARAVSGVMVCEYSISVKPDGGDAGEDGWRVRLSPGPDGRLQDASVSRFHIGMPGQLGD